MSSGEINLIQLAQAIADALKNSKLDEKERERVAYEISTRLLIHPRPETLRAVIYEELSGKVNEEKLKELLMKVDEFNRSVKFNVREYKLAGLYLKSLIMSYLTIF